jgi:spore maturation protein CgeB
VHLDEQRRDGHGDLDQAGAPVKILVLTTTRRDTAEVSIAQALSSVHDVTAFDYERQRILTLRPGFHRLNILLYTGLKALKKPATHFADQALLRWVKGKRFDLVFIVAITTVPPDVVAALKRETGALVVGWFTDAIVNLGAAEFVSAPYHRIFFKDKIVVDRFRDALATDRYDYLPQGFDPEIHRPAPARLAPKGAAADVATFGNSYAFRAYLMGALLAQRDIRTIIYGSPSWIVDPALRAVYRAPVVSLEKSAAMGVTKIALNTNHFSELGGVNKRTFELTGMGAFQLTDGPCVAEYYEPGEECVTFRGPDELVEKVRYYLAHPEERVAVARRGLLRAWRDHTYHRRLNQAFAAIPELRSAEALPVPAGPPEPEAGL